MTDQETIQRAASEDAALIARVVALVKQAKTDKAGAISGALAAIPAAEAAVKDSIAAFGAIKSGSKTTEFWFNIAIVALTTALATLGHPMPTEQVIALYGLGGIYTFARSLVKKTPSPTQVTVSTGTPPATPATVVNVAPPAATA